MTNINCLDCRNCHNCENCYGLYGKNNLTNIICLNNKHYEITDKIFKMNTIENLNTKKQEKTLYKLPKIKYIENTNSLDCYKCKICNNCVKCDCCYSCTDCNNCIRCKNCVYCNNCYECLYDENCKNCFNCIDCKDCIDCKNCYGLYNKTGLTNVVSLLNKKHTEMITYKIIDKKFEMSELFNLNGNAIEMQIKHLPKVLYKNNNN